MQPGRGAGAEHDHREGLGVRRALPFGHARPSLRAEVGEHRVGEREGGAGGSIGLGPTMVLEDVRVEVGVAPEPAGRLGGDGREQHRRDTERGARDDTHPRVPTELVQRRPGRLVLDPTGGPDDEHPGTRVRCQPRAGQDGVRVRELERHVDGRERGRVGARGVAAQHRHDRVAPRVECRTERAAHVAGAQEECSHRSVSPLVSRWWDRSGVGSDARHEEAAVTVLVLRPSEPARQAPFASSARRPARPLPPGRAAGAST